MLVDFWANMDDDVIAYDGWKISSSTVESIRKLEGCYWVCRVPTQSWHVTDLCWETIREKGRLTNGG